MLESERAAPARPTIYFDFGSPYAYLAIERAEDVLGSPVDLEPVLLGAIFKRRGWGSWAQTEQRAARVAELEERARRYGLPPFRWPARWPTTSLAANRAGVWAKSQRAVQPFVRAVFRRQFSEGGDIAQLDVLTAAAADAGLDAAALEDAIRRQEVKDALREATDAAWERGVRGVPSILVGGEIFYGDDKLEQAASRL